MGERTGNTRLPEIVATLHDHTEFRTAINEKKLEQYVHAAISDVEGIEKLYKESRGRVIMRARAEGISPGR